MTIIGPGTSGTTVSGNTIAGSENNVAAVKATNVQITDNRIGTNPAGTGLGAPNLLASGNGVVLDGASGITVSGNTIAEQNQFNVLVLGVPTANAQVTISGNGENAYTDVPFGGTVTGTNNTISNNSIGLAERAGRRRGAGTRRRRRACRSPGAPTTSPSPGTRSARSREWVWRSSTAPPTR